MVVQKNAVSLRQEIINILKQGANKEQNCFKKYPRKRLQKANCEVKLWSGQRESNPPIQLGKLTFYQ